MSGFYHTEYSQEEIKKLLEVGARRAAIPINFPEDDANKNSFNSMNAVSSGLSAAEQKLMEISKKIYLFEGLSSNEVLHIVKNVQFVRFAQNEYVFNQGGGGLEMFFILTGFVDVYVTALNNRNGKVGRVEAGHILGEMAFIARRPRYATCISSAASTTAIKFEINEDAVCDKNAMLFLQLYINVSNSLALKLEQANNTIVMAQ